MFSWRWTVTVCDIYPTVDNPQFVEVASFPLHGWTNLDTKVFTVSGDLVAFVNDGKLSLWNIKQNTMRCLKVEENNCISVD